MLATVTYPKSSEYRTGSDNEPICFFLNALPNSNQFDILLGYFSSSAIHVLSLGFANFIYRGGKVRMVINHILSKQDKKALIIGVEEPEPTFGFSIHNYKQIKEALDDYGKHFYHCLAWLIAAKRIEIKVIKPKLGKGISHYKSGVFSDGKDKVKFKSSCNFTAYALLENLEELDIKKSWSHSENEVALEEYETYFNDIFSGEADFVEYISFQYIEEAIRTDFGNKEIDELLIEENRLIQKKQGLQGKSGIQTILENLEKQNQKLLTTPKFPFNKPRPYQIDANVAWIANDFKGMFAMATGTGKSLTALNCVFEEYKKSESYRAIILVPTIELVSQWKEGIIKFRFKNITTVSSTNKNWRTDLRRITTLSKNDPSYSFFIVTTYKSFTSTRFQSALLDLPRDTILIADEAHNCGSPSVLALLEEFPLEKRIGLSATPERIYDEEGTIGVDEFFNDTRPYTFEYSMQKALDKEYLCQYYYYPILVELTENKLKEYIDISKRLGRLYGSDDPEIQETAENLLLLRKQIIHKAVNKLNKFDELIADLAKKGELNYTLVYAPEGYFDEDILEQDSLNYLDADENRICEYYSSRIRALTPSTKVGLFNSSTTNRKYLLDQFSDGDIDVLVSMKCLDEGVDIPRTGTAIFCASTGNPRQFIQRRGRILRTHDDKKFAHIYDFVVVPSMTTIAGDLAIERKLVETELRRVVEFADLAVNKRQALEVLDGIISMYNINTIF